MEIEGEMSLSKYCTVHIQKSNEVRLFNTPTLFSAPIRSLPFSLQFQVPFKIAVDSYIIITQTI